jgi:hypothetical protein
MTLFFLKTKNQSRKITKWLSLIFCFLQEIEPNVLDMFPVCSPYLNDLLVFLPNNTLHNKLPIQVVFQSSLDYENKETQAAIGNLMENLKNYSLMRNDIEINWLSSFHHISGHKRNSLVLMFLVNKYIRDAVIDFSSLEKIMSSLNISVAFTNCLRLW